MNLKKLYKNDTFLENQKHFLESIKKQISNKTIFSDTKDVDEFAQVFKGIVEKIDDINKLIEKEKKKSSLVNKIKFYVSIPVLILIILYHIYQFISLLTIITLLLLSGLFLVVNISNDNAYLKGFIFFITISVVTIIVYYVSPELQQQINNLSGLITLLGFLLAIIAYNNN